MDRARKEWFRSFFDREYVDLLIDQKPRAETEREVDFIAGAVGLVRGDRVLDIPCGYGRHAAALAGRGIEVTGVDLSPAMIAEAERRFGRRRRLRFRRGDMRRIDFRAEFDAVLNLFTAFGYFSHREDRAVIGRFARALRPGGRLLVDHRDPDFDAGLAPRRRWSRAGGRYVLEDLTFDRARLRETLALRILRPGDRRVRRKVASFNVYRLDDWRRMLGAAGLRLVAAFNGFDGGPYRRGRGPRLLILAEKPAGRRR